MAGNAICVTLSALILWGCLLMATKARRSTTKAKRDSSGKSRSKKRKKVSRKKNQPSYLRFVLGRLLLVFIILLSGTLIYLDAWVQDAFSGKKWAIPAKVYARPLELYTGLRLSPEDFQAELLASGYRFGDGRKPGSVEKQGDQFQLTTRGFRFWDGEEPSQNLRVSFNRQRVEAVYNRAGQPLNIVRIEPLQIGGIYPAHNEDRLLVQLEEVPEGLQQALIVVEDREFYQHYGISPKSIARAMLVNVKSGRLVQGGSTLTQQLVKNFFLSSDRTLLRKGVEAVMALLLELHFDKDEIFETYLNEVYLGQSGPRSIHGFGLASRYYFSKSISDLRLHQYALLVALVKGPSFYDPWRNPQRALKRRNLVIDLLEQHGVVEAREAKFARQQGLSVGERSSRSRQSYPAYLDLVRRQLRKDYREEDLSSEGLQIFTNFDPVVQWKAERSLSQTIARLEKSKGLKDEGQGKHHDSRIEGAVVVTSIENGELLAVVGGREPRYAGFNRALDALRPIGSLIKPAVYLTALEDSRQYTLASMISDAPVAVQGADGSMWEPANFDHRDHGELPLHRSLALSYNQATARLGMMIGLENVLDTLARLGIEREFLPVPALLLGALELSPFEVSIMYQTIAAGGFQSPLRAIREILDKQGQPLKRYPLSVEQKISPEAVHLLQYALLEVMREGTGRSAYQVLRTSQTVAGKTGTSDEQRDSWFAGYSGDRLAVVWLGRDDNGVTPLTGSSGALKVWRDLMFKLSERSVVFNKPEGVEYFWVDDQSGLLSAKDCQYARYLPFIIGTEPKRQAACKAKPGAVSSWLRSWFKQ